MRICVPLVEKNEDALLASLEKAVEKKADIVEIWLGELFPHAGDFEKKGKNLLAKIFEQKKKLGNISLLFNVKDVKEKGNFCGTPEEKAEILEACFAMGAEMVDVDFCFPDALREKIACAKKFPFQKLILSAHFFEGTPTFPSLKNRIQIMQNRGADIVKIAAMPETPKDMIVMLRLAENLGRQKIPFIALSMGQMGKISRIFSPLLGAEFTFAPYDENMASAPGQMSMEKILELQKFFVF